MAETKKTSVNAEASEASKAKSSPTARVRSRKPSTARGAAAAAKSTSRVGSEAEVADASPREAKSSKPAGTVRKSVASKSASASRAQTRASRPKQGAARTPDPGAEPASGSIASADVSKERGAERKASAAAAKAKPKARTSARVNAKAANSGAAPSKGSARSAKAGPAAIAEQGSNTPRARVSVGIPLQVGRGTATVATAAIKPAADQRKSAPVAEKSDAREKKSIDTRHGFKLHEYVVYPSHGVGQIVGIEDQEIAGMSLELFVITFEKDKMTLRVPTSKLQSVGMRKLAQGEVLQKALDTLKGRARVKRTMWSRRAQEYEAKINSGDIVAIAEVVRDLYRSDSQPEQSYSERQLFEAALDRMAREVAAVENIDERGSNQRIIEILSKSAKMRKAAADEAARDDDADGEPAAA